MMSSPLEKPKVFIITYDGGDRQQTLRVEQPDFEKHEELRKYVIKMKCLACNFESSFSEEKHE